MRVFKAADNRIYTCYPDYLQSALWLAIKQDYRKHHPKQFCHICQTTEGQFDIHHKHYTTIGRESRNDIIELCHSCHPMRLFIYAGFHINDDSKTYFT